jgi:peroxin-7
MPRFKTTFNGYSVKFSPFIENRLAVATAQNFGIIGNGRLHVLEVSAAAVGALLPHQQQQQQCALRL